MKNTVLERGKLTVVQHRDYIEAEYLLPKLRNQPACAAITNFFNTSAIKAIPEFDTWKETLFEKCRKKEYACMCIYETTLVYSYYIKLIQNEAGDYFWKVNIMIGTEERENEE